MSNDYPQFVSPDYEMEQFWFTFKASINNYWRTYLDKLKIDNPLVIWSDILNQLQKEEKYDIICQNIHNYLHETIYFFFQEKSFYHINILYWE